MKLEDAGRPAPCGECGQVRPSEDLMLEGPELEPICLDCLERLDPARAQILKTIQNRRKSP